MNLEWKAAPPDRDPGVYGGGLRYLVDGEVRDWTGESFEVLSSTYQPGAPGLERRVLGRCARPDETVARAALAAAVKAWDTGRGAWPTAPVAHRIRCLETFLEKMKEKRLEVARLITWEIGKPWADSLAEFDRTVEYGVATVEALKDLDRTSSRFVLDGGFLAQIRRSPFGVTLCMGPFNYPLNETFATLLPALVMGNTVISKLPRIGMLCQLPLLEAFASSFPPGVINILPGDGATVVGPMMSSGEIDVLAFIGSAKVANHLKKSHPRPNRLRCILGLGAKNPAIILGDADLAKAVPECVSGALTFNGQRCTALKILFVERRIADEFAERAGAEVSKLRPGMPFEDKVALTPLPDDRAVETMRTLVAEAVAKGARIVNPDGGTIDRTYFHPAVLYPAAPAMEIYHGEQFGPVVPIVPFDHVDEIIEWIAASPFGQQASLFTSDPKRAGALIDRLANQVCRVNLNSQCRRGPDSFPFGGRKDSAEGTLSITDALRVFSIRALVAAKETPENVELVKAIAQQDYSGFLNTNYLF